MAGEESCGAFLARIGTDGQLWAKAFMDAYMKGGDDFLTEETMTGWFANAIEAGRSAGFAVNGGGEDAGASRHSEDAGSGIIEDC